MSTRDIDIRVDDHDRLLVVVDGRAVPPGARVTLTAEQLALFAREYAWAGIAAGRKAGTEATATAALRAGAAAIRATVDAAVQAGAQATGQRAFDAGVRYAAHAIASTSVVRRRVERDASGQVVGTVEYRAPRPEGGQ